MVHGDVNRYNSIVDAKDGTGRLVDFERAEEYDEGRAQKEIESLAAELVEETGRGGPAVFRGS